MSRSLDARVTRGAHWLDLHTPDWSDEIDVDTLRMGSPRQCILGQVYGNYFVAADQFTLTCSATIKLGFNGSLVGLLLTAELFRLRRAWRKLILARRAAQESADAVPLEAQ